MQIGLRLPQSADLTIFTTRIDGVKTAGVDGSAPLLDEIDFSDPVAVANARTALLHADVWENFLEVAFFSGNKANALDTTVDTILCLKAAAWKESRKMEPAYGLAPEDLLSAQISFFSMLTPRGLMTMTEAYEVEAEGIRYTPKTGQAAVDGLLRMVVSEQVMNGLRALGPRAKLVADTLDELAQALKQAETGRTDVKNWAAAAMEAERDGNPYRAAVAIRMAAEAWGTPDQSRFADVHGLRVQAWECTRIGDRMGAAYVEAYAARILEDMRMEWEGKTHG